MHIAVTDAKNVQYQAMPLHGAPLPRQDHCSHVSRALIEPILYSKESRR